jgi:lipopolysaccharide export system protein LptC
MTRLANQRDWKPIESNFSRQRPKVSLYIIPRLRWLLPLLAIVLFGSIIIWPQIARWLEEDNLPNLAQQLTKQPTYQNTASDVTYTGVDKKNRPFVLDGNQAIEFAPDQVEVESPKLTLDLSDNKKSTLSANKAFVDKEKKLIHLVGDVTLTHTDGYEFKTSEAWLDLASYSAYGDKPVTGNGPTGKIQASKGFRIKKDQKSLEFFGRPELILRSTGGKKK